MFQNKTLLVTGGTGSFGNAVARRFFSQEIKGYRIPSDARDLNYAIYTNEGESATAKAVDYTSENTRRLTDEELIDALLELDYIQQELQEMGTGS